jgi:hypothetical protein
MIKLDFEFVSTHRNRSIWPNPCFFEVPWSGSGQSSGLNAYDPISNQAPIVSWTGQNISINATVVSQTNNTVVVSALANSFSQLPNYYQGAELSVPPSYRIDSSNFIAQSGGLDYAQFSSNIADSTLQAGNAVVIKVTSVPNTLYVPQGSDLPNAYVGDYLYNETQGTFTIITGYDSVLHKVIANIPVGWSTTDKYSIRSQPPSAGNFMLGGGNTTTSLNLIGIPTFVNPGDFIRIISTEEIVKIVSYNSITNIANVSPPLSIPFPAGTIVELLTQTSDNYRTLSYTGSVVGQQEQVSYDINLVSASIPNIAIKNGIGGYPVDYPFLYIELYDTNYPSQNNLFSNNHSNKSYFKVTTPVGQLIDRTEKFTKFTGDLSYKTIRFRPTSNFRVVWRLPNGEEIKFVQQDTQSPQAPNEALQTSVMFNLRRE